MINQRSGNDNTSDSGHDRIISRLPPAGPLSGKRYIILPKDHWSKTERLKTKNKTQSLTFKQPASRPTARRHASHWPPWCN